MAGTNWLQNRKSSIRPFHDPLLLNIPDLAFGYKTKKLISNNPPQLRSVESMKALNNQNSVSNLHISKNRSTMTPYQGHINFSSSQNVFNSLSGGQSHQQRPHTTQLNLKRFQSKESLMDGQSLNDNNSMDAQQNKDSNIEKEAKLIKKNFVKLQELATDDKQTIEKQKCNLQNQKQQHTDLLRNYRLLQEEMKKLRINYQAEINDRKALKEELEKLKESYTAQEKKINQLQLYITDCEKQIIKISSDNLEIKMNEEKTRNSVGAIQKNYENWIDQLNQTISKKDIEKQTIQEQLNLTIKSLEEKVELNQGQYDTLLEKYKVFEDMINNAKGFKPGTTDFDRMQGKMNKLEADLYLYKKLIQKNERDQKKLEEEWMMQKQELESSTVNLLAELRTVKEHAEKKEKEYLDEILDLKEQFLEVKQEKDNNQEHIDFITNELKLVKEVNLNFRQENNRVLNQFAGQQKTIEDLKMNQFKLNETNIKMKKDVQRMSKDIMLAKEEKEVAELEYLDKLNTMNSMRHSGIDGMTAFEMIQEEAKQATQSEFKRMVQEKSLELEKERIKTLDLKQSYEEIQQRLEEMQQRNIHLESQQESLNSNLEEQKQKMANANSFIEEVKQNLEGLKKFMDKIAEIMTCLSCMNFLEQPLMLQCGHSICKDCVSKHLHPFKKDSMVLCEKCTFSTVAKSLKNSVVLDTLAYCFQEIHKGVRKNNQLHDTKGQNLNLITNN